VLNDAFAAPVLVACTAETASWHPVVTQFVAVPSSATWERSNPFATVVRQGPLRNSSSNHVPRSFKKPRRGYGLSGITAFALVISVLRRELVMPIGRYIAWVGASLLALLFVADWFLPKPLPEPTGDPIEGPSFG
jgi:hypothetical protein